MRSSEIMPRRKWLLRITAGLVVFCLVSLVFLNSMTQITILAAQKEAGNTTPAIEYLLGHTDYLNEGWFQRNLSVLAAMTAPKTSYRQSDTFAAMHIGREEYDAALPYVRQCLALTAGEDSAAQAKLMMKLGALLLLTQDTYGAIASLEGALQKDSSLLDAHAMLAQAYADKGNLSQAANHLEQFLIESSNPAQLNALGDLYAAQGQYEDAQRAYTRAVAGGGGTGYARYMRGVSWMALENYEQAEQDFSACIKAGTELAASLFQRGVANLKLSRFHQAEIDFSSGLELAQSDDPSLFFNRGVSRMAQNAYAGAIEDFAVSANSQDYAAESFYNSSVCHYEMGSDSLGLASIDAFLSAGGDPLRTAEIRALARMRLEDYAGALEDFQVLAIAELMTPQILLNRGFCLMKTGQFEDAVLDFTSCIEGGVQEKQALYFRAACYQALGYKEIAMADLEKAVE